MKRMSRQEFFGKLAACGQGQLEKVLWNLYWRGTAAIRERIEVEIDPELAENRRRISSETVDPESVLEAVRDFAGLARSGSYMGGDRCVSPRERKQWRFTFQRLAADAQAALYVEDPVLGAGALEELIDLACELRDYDYFHSEDAVEAARFVVSDAVALLWSRVFEHDGFPLFAERAAPQLIRWESRHGWTRTGFGRTREKERSLASVLAGLLRIPDAWAGFADRYLEALGVVARADQATPRQSWKSAASERENRTAVLSEWHLMLLDRLVTYEAEDRLDRLAGHPALGGPELTFLQARLAHRRGDASHARKLVHESLVKLPGHRGFLSFALEIGAPLPARAQEIAASLGTHNRRAKI